MHKVTLLIPSNNIRSLDSIKFLQKPSKRQISFWQMAEGTKLTGDPNVPFKKVTFRSFLSQALLYTNVEDQVCFNDDYLLIRISVYQHFMSHQTFNFNAVGSPNWNIICFWGRKISKVENHLKAEEPNGIIWWIPVFKMIEKKLIYRSSQSAWSEILIFGSYISNLNFTLSD